ncbi:MAG: vWA domain-containing protein, partial [Chloroflexota bacterium]|nr:vWA domain-containing protein [Chloroflexota bacterium]
GEAATVDLVIVIDSSESMASEDDGEPYTYVPGNFNPATCEPNCEPFKSAKDAAKSLVDAMFEGYDQIAVVNFDFDAEYSNLNGDFAAVKTAIDAIPLHDDINADDFGPVGVPGQPGVHPFDLDSDGCLGARDDNTGSCTGVLVNDSYLSTCIGCGIRAAGIILKQNARPNSVWVIAFLTDGVTNVSNIPPEVDAFYTQGYCFDTSASITWCQDGDSSTRHCGPYHADATECPPGATWVGDGSSSPYYDVEDYAYDMVDEVALTASTNANEPITGNDIAIYSIGLGQAADAATNYVGEDLLRYMANVGDEGTRLNDPCAASPHQEQCGNYYYAPGSSYLNQIFESIAARIYTRISY